MTLYFKGSGGMNWDTLANWWTDSAGTVPASALPTDGDAVIILSALTAGPSVAVQPASVTFENPGPFETAYLIADLTALTCPIVFNGGSAMENGAVTNAIFNGSSSINSGLAVNATFNGASSIQMMGHVTNAIWLSSGAVNGQANCITNLFLPITKVGAGFSVPKAPAPALYTNLFVIGVPDAFAGAIMG